MWIPVLESKKLGPTPQQVNYWGSKLVVYRTASGTIGALDDCCGHRGVPLSRGKIDGELIRCGYHHYAYDQAGACVDVPAVQKVSEAARRRCDVRRYFARECIGLIWVSVQDEPRAPFPVDLGLVPEQANVATGSFELDGDVRVWMDHFLDLPHALYAHARSFFGPGREPELLTATAPPIAPGATYPLRPWASFEVRAGHAPLRSRLFSPAVTLSMLLSGAAAMRYDYSKVTVDLPGPFCQRYNLVVESPLGDHDVDFWTAINPRARDRLSFTYAGYFRSSAFFGARRRGPLVRRIQQRVLPLFLERHIIADDSRFLGPSRYMAREHLEGKPFDECILGMRELLERYLIERKPLFARDSLAHEIYA
jgi:nitrite reductase/ring-hydroxylating ferredoxin subunit